jgi:hypothetical protein
MTADPADNSAADGGLVVETEPGLEDIRFLEDGLIDFNIQTTGITDGNFIGIFLRGNDGSRTGGLYGWVWGSTCYVRYLFVAESLCRRSGSQSAKLQADRARDPQLSGARLLPEARLRRDRPRRRLSTGSRISDAGQTSGLRIGVSRPSSCVIACGDAPTAAYWRLSRADDDVAGIGVAGRDLVRRISLADDHAHERALNSSSFYLEPFYLERIGRAGKRIGRRRYLTPNSVGFGRYSPQANRHGENEHWTPILGRRLCDRRWPPRLSLRRAVDPGVPFAPVAS